MIKKNSIIVESSSKTAEMKNGFTSRKEFIKNRNVHFFERIKLMRKTEVTNATARINFEKSKILG
jgi:hypothetical protein